MIRRILLLLPLALGAAAMAAGAALLMGNLAAVALRLTGPDGMKLAHGLAGASFAEQPQLSLQAVAQGRFQAAFARVVGARMPLYPLAVRVRNQVEYSLFGLSAAPNLLIGPDGVLSEVAYAREYCARAPGWQADGARWAAGIREMQDDAERRGKAFLYVLTPSKVAQYPQVLPPGWACPASAVDRAGFVPEWMALLRAAGVHAVDTSTVLLAAHGDYPFPLYPTGGTHWNAVGAALAEQAIMAALDRLLPGRGFAPFRFTWRMAPHPDPDGTDQDLARLTNLFHMPDDGPVPAVTLQPAPAAGRVRPTARGHRRRQLQQWAWHGARQLAVSGAGRGISILARAAAGLSGRADARPLCGAAARAGSRGAGGERADLRGE